jgi:hypothetical protein
MDDSHWVRTVGAPGPDDPRDGELHQLFGPLPDHFDLEPWDDDPDDESTEGYVRYFKSDRAPLEDDEGRTVWLYEFRPDGEP